MPSHYLNQCWCIVNWTPGNKFEWNSNRNFHSRKCILNCRLPCPLPKWRTFCPEGDELIKFILHMARMLLFKWMVHRSLADHVYSRTDSYFLFIKWGNIMTMATILQTTFSSTYSWMKLMYCYSIFNQAQFWPSGIVLASVCVCTRVCVWITSLSAQ